MKCRDLILAVVLASLPVTLFAAPAGAADGAGLIAHGNFTTPRVRAGDTVEYRLRVEWRDVPAALIVLPPGDELKTPGLTLIGQSALHRKTASAGATRNISEFTYLLVAREPGTGRVSPFLLRYRSGLSDRTDDRIESVPVEGSTLEIGPARIAWLRSGKFSSAAIALLALVSVALFLASRTILGKRDPKHNHKGARPGNAGPPEDAFTRSVEELRHRCDTADSRLWLADAEKLCVAYLCRSLGVTQVRDVRFEAALDRYLSRPHAPDGDASWSKLKDLFHEARYAGGRKPPHELREACRHLKTCLSPHSFRTEPTSANLEKR